MVIINEKISFKVIRKDCTSLMKTNEKKLYYLKVLNKM